MNTFVNDDSATGDIYEWQDAEGFGVETDTVRNSYIDTDTGVEISSGMNRETVDVLKDMGFNYNLSGYEKRLLKFSKKYENSTKNDYDSITNILGNDLYLMLKETGYLDSDQVIDEILTRNLNPSAKEIERALLSMLADINDIETSNVNTVMEAMDLGFTLDEALELTEIDMRRNILPQEGIQELSDRIMYEIGQTKMQKQLEQELREQGEQYRRRN